MSQTASSPISRLVSYLKSVQAEWKYISWPTFQEASTQFIVVLVVSAALTVFLFGVDLGLSAALKNLQTALKIS